MKNILLKLKRGLDTFMLNPDKENRDTSLKLVQLYNKFFNGEVVKDYIELERYQR